MNILCLWSLQQIPDVGTLGNICGDCSPVVVSAECVVAILSSFLCFLVYLKEPVHSGTTLCRDWA